MKTLKRCTQFINYNKNGKESLFINDFNWMNDY